MQLQARNCFAILGDRHHDNKNKQRQEKAGKKLATTHTKNGAKQAYNLIAEYQQRDTLEALLLRMGYPVLMSNRTDPFGLANRNAAIPLMKVMTELGIPIAVQTKGFKREEDLEEVLDFLPPSCWYISIAFNDDDLRKKIEPGATTIQHRLDLIETLRDKGHSVVVGINPCVEEWLPRPQELIDELVKRGVWGAWIQTLHLSPSQAKQLRPRELEALTPELVERVKKNKGDIGDDPDSLFFFKVREMCQEAGLEIFSIGQATRSNFFDAYRKHYPVTFPTLQDFVNLCHDAELQDGEVVTFDDFAAETLPYLPEGKLCIGHYIGATAHNVCREHEKWSNWMTYEDLLKMIWADSRIGMNPTRTAPFSFATVGGNLLLDDNGLPCLVWSSEGHSDLYVEVE